MDEISANEPQPEGGIPIRSRLLLLTVAGLLPLAAMAGFALLALAHQQRVQVEQAGLEIARALSTAIDVEIMSSISALEAVASTLEHEEGFGEADHRVLAMQPHWAALVVHDLEGAALFHSGDPPSDALSDPQGRMSFERVLRERRPIVGALSSPSDASPSFPVRVPVVRGGAPVFVLSAAVKPDGLLEVVNRQRLPADWIISVFDGTGAPVARSRGNQEAVGWQATSDRQGPEILAGHEGTGAARALEGDEVHTAYTRSANTGFAVALGMPPSFVDAGARRSLVTYGGGILLSLLLGVLAARAVARSVIRPIGALHDAAQALGRRGPVRAPTTTIVELRQVGESLALAAAERARGEAERERLLRREQEARALAEAANRAKDEFLAMLGHELRNPLGAISNASLLLDDPRIDGNEVARAKEIIARQVGHMARLTDDLLDAARAVTGKIVLQRRPLDLAAATAHVVEAGWTGGACAQRRIVQQLEPVWVDADPTRVEQIVGNLLGNAVKYSHESGTITVSVRPDGADAVLCVTDDGVGMEPDFVERVFEPFVQGESGLDRQQGGLGIGLTMVRRLVELHGGSVFARSMGLGRGSEFFVRLPATKTPAQMPAPTPAPVPVPERPAGRRILIVEDNDDARDSLRRLLELEGHHVTACSDGSSALDGLRAAASEVALIDIGLPGMDGYELAGHIRAAVGDATLLVALTGYGLAADRSRTQAAGFDLHLVKPVDRETLEDVLRRS